MSELFSSHEQEILMPSLAGNLQLKIAAAEKSPLRGVAIICHPHPLQGGTMENKVVTTLVKTLRALGLATIRFNFRGVGKSTGVHDEGRGESEDVLTIMQWAKTQMPQQPIWLAGFSFGAYIAAKVAANEPSIAQLILVAPPVKYAEFANLKKFPCPVCLVQGQQDEIVSPQAVLQWAAQIEPAPTLLKFPQAGHFFHGQLLLLAQQILNALRT